MSVSLIYVTCWRNSIESRNYDREAVGSCPGQVVTTWMGDCLRTDKSSRYKTNTKVNSALHPSGIGKSSLTGVNAGRVHLCRMAGKTV